MINDESHVYDIMYVSMVRGWVDDGLLYAMPSAVHKESLKSVKIGVGDSPGCGLPSVAIMP